MTVPRAPRRRHRLDVVSANPDYVGRLADAYHAFLFFCTNAICASFSPRTSVSGTDLALRRYVQWCHDHRRPQSEAVYAIIAVQHKFCLRHRLPRAWHAVRLWKQYEPGHPRVPLPFSVLQLLFATCLSRSSTACSFDRVLWLCAGIIFYVGYVAMLRPGEMAQLLRQDAVFQNELLSMSSRFGVLSLFAPKNRRTLGVRQFTVIECDVATSWLCWLCHDLPEHCAVCPCSLEKLRDMFKELCVLYDLILFTLACVRTGGACDFFRLHDHNLGRLQYAGRWGCEATVRHYLQSAMSSLALARVPPKTCAVIEKLHDVLPLLSTPPQVSCREWLGEDLHLRRVAVGLARGRQELRRRRLDL